MKPLADIVIISHAKSRYYYGLTSRAVNSCLRGTEGLPVKVTVVEQAPGIHYEEAETLFCDAPFNYNAFANFGAGQGSANWIMIANNDLVFHPGWLRALLRANCPVVSPRCPDNESQKHITGNMAGYDNGIHFSGWCFMIRRSLWEQIGRFDTDVNFWCSDDVVIEQLKAADVEPVVVSGALVTHMVSATLHGLPFAEQQQLTRNQVKIFNRKYKQNLFGWGE